MANGAGNALVRPLLNGKKRARTMGMHDELYCDAELPDAAVPAGATFETKAFPHPFLYRYRITKVGRLIDAFGRDLECDGYLEFYHYLQRSVRDCSLAEYRAHFCRGQLNNIVRVKREPEVADVRIIYGLAAYRIFALPAPSSFMSDTGEDVETPEGPRSIEPKLTGTRHSVGAIDSAAMQDDHDPIKPESRSDLLDDARAAYVASYEQDQGPIDPQLTAELEARFAYAGITPINQSAINPHEQHADHQRLDARSLAMHCLVARKLLADPTLVAKARGTLARWRVQTAEPSPSYFLEWERILEGSPEEVADFLASMREDATRLRQSSPFTGILTPEERSRIYEAFR
jgi:hypothetical protein